MEIKLKRFEDTNTRIENRITITSIGTIGLPTYFYNTNKIKNYKFAVLFYDKRNKIVGIYFTNDDKEKGIIKILVNKQGYGGSIITKNYFKLNQIDPKKYQNKYVWEKYSQPGVGDVYVIKLDNPKNTKQ